MVQAAIHCLVKRQFSVKMFSTGHLFLFGCSIACVIAHAIDSTPPLCGAIDGESNDKEIIHFKDSSRGIRTIEMNGTIVGCYPSAVVYDEPRSDASLALTTSFRPNISTCAGHYDLFCSSGDNYPIDYVQFILQKHWHMLSFAFHNDAIDPEESTIDSIVQTETEMCNTQDEIIYPTSAQNMNGKNLFILNTPEHQQGVRVSMCRAKNEECQVSLQFLYRSQCEQRYVYRELLALSSDGVPIKDKFKFPAFCTCKVYYDNNINPNKKPGDERLTLH